MRPRTKGWWHGADNGIRDKGVTALAPHIGYNNSAKIAKLALKNKTTLKHEALKSKLINEKDYNKIVDPKKMIYPA